MKFVYVYTICAPRHSIRIFHWSKVITCNSSEEAYEHGSNWMQLNEEIKNFKSSLTLMNNSWFANDLVINVS